eukprot:jgi/Bigna1/139490/aug1.50_g14198
MSRQASFCLYHCDQVIITERQWEEVGELSLRHSWRFTTARLTKEKSPHVAAGLLKLWIRNLPEPLIPSHLYEEAVKIGKKQSEIQAADIRKFTSKIPVLNRRVIDYIATLAKEIEKLKDVNRMDMTNIAIVFAPGMLQDPGDDPAVMLANSKYEIKFTVALFTHFPHSDESEASR